MVSAPERPVKVKEVMEVLRKLGYKRKRADASGQTFVTEDGGFQSLPADPEQVMLRRWLHMIIAETGLGMREFERVLRTKKRSVRT